LSLTAPIAQPPKAISQKPGATRLILRILQRFTREFDPRMHVLP
jgi:hypothetical protein